MVHHLEVPLPLTRFQVHAEQALTEQIVAWTMAAVEIGCGRFNREVNQSEFFVDGDLRPDSRVAVCGPRIVVPSCVDMPTNTTPLTTVGVEWRPASPVSRSICWPVPWTTPSLRSTMPSL